MNSWLFRNNKALFNIEKAFSTSRIIIMPEPERIEQGDVVYIYSDACKAIKYKCLALDTHMSMIDNNTVRFVRDPAFYDGTGAYMRLKLLTVYPDDLITEKELETIGITDPGLSLQLSSDQVSQIEELTRGLGRSEEKPPKEHQEKETVRQGDGNRPPEQPNVSYGRNHPAFVSGNIPPAAEKAAEPTPAVQPVRSTDEVVVPAYNGGGGTAKKKKTWIPFVIAGVLAAGLLFFFTYHVYDPPTCENPSVCSICGKVINPALGHDWEAATYETPETCSRCGETRGDVKGMIDSVPTHWADEQERFEEADIVNDISVVEFSEINKCMKMNITFGLDEDFVDHDWNVAFRSNGEWSKWYVLEKESIDDYALSPIDGYALYTPGDFVFDPHIDIDAVLIYPRNTRGGDSWGYTVQINYAQAE